MAKIPNQYSYNLKMASANSQIFQLTSGINQLKEAGKNILAASEKTNFNSDWLFNKFSEKLYISTPF
ncbi:hypothetical protein BST83_05340 [Polaribacter filamentus]|uniref:Uncharacterized protein n=1 Tax=Polaribacter filamentus TaxID=53483 RepID=A0A2S7KVG8_9FLAO|nr:hypothetical protein [Polaribacter filamentus]PQB06644.1 hypothetical protein BST83_05340 [Polaribacter filamentus]